MHMCLGSIHDHNRDLLFHTLLHNFSWITCKIFKIFYVFVYKRKLGIANPVSFKAMIEWAYSNILQNISIS